MISNDEKKRIIKLWCKNVDGRKLIEADYPEIDFFKEVMPVTGRIRIVDEAFAVLQNYEEEAIFHNSLSPRLMYNAGVCAYADLIVIVKALNMNSDRGDVRWWPKLVLTDDRGRVEPQVEVTKVAAAPSYVPEGLLLNSEELALYCAATFKSLFEWMMTKKP